MPRGSATIGAAQIMARAPPPPGLKGTSWVIEPTKATVLTRCRSGMLGRLVASESEGGAE